MRVIHRTLTTALCWYSLLQPLAHGHCVEPTAALIEMQNIAQNRIDTDLRSDLEIDAGLWSLTRDEAFGITRPGILSAWVGRRYLIRYQTSDSMGDPARNLEALRRNEAWIASLGLKGTTSLGLHAALAPNPSLIDTIRLSEQTFRRTRLQAYAIQPWEDGILGFDWITQQAPAFAAVADFVSTVSRDLNSIPSDSPLIVESTALARRFPDAPLDLHVYELQHFLRSKLSTIPLDPEDRRTATIFWRHWLEEYFEPSLLIQLSAHMVARRIPDDGGDFHPANWIIGPDGIVRSIDLELTDLNRVERYRRAPIQRSPLISGERWFQPHFLNEVLLTYVSDAMTSALESRTLDGLIALTSAPPAPSDPEGPEQSSQRMLQRIQDTVHMIHHARSRIHGDGTATE